MGGLVNNAPFLTTFALNLDHDSKMIGTIVAIYDVGCCIGALLSSIYAERLGRRTSILLGCLWMVLGAVLQTVSWKVHMLLIGRIISGLGMGAINSTVPILQAEMSVPQSRGRLACVQLSTLNFGIMLSYWIDYGFSVIPLQQQWLWRVPVGLQLIFIVILIFLTLAIPESPRWLIAHGHKNEAQRILARLENVNVNDAAIVDEISSITQSFDRQRELEIGRWLDVFKYDDLHSRRRFIIACGIQMAQQLGGINAMIYYSGIIFQKSLQLSNKTSNLLSGCLFTWFLLASFIPYALIDRLGRRRLLLSTIAGMTMCFGVLAGIIKALEDQNISQQKLGYAATAMIFLYLGLFTIGFQAVVWVIPSEILPSRLRSKGSAVSTAGNWIVNYAVVQITPLGIHALKWKFYLMFCIFNASFLLPIYFFLPETAGKSLEAIDFLFSTNAPQSAGDESDDVPSITHEALPRNPSGKYGIRITERGV